MLALLSACGGGGGPEEHRRIPDPESSEATGPGAVVVADGVATAVISITVRAQSGAPVAGEQVEIAVSGSLNTVLQPAQPTDAAGRTSASVSSLRAEAKSVTVTVDPRGAAVVLADVPVLHFVGDPDTLDPGLSSVTAAPAAGVVADGVAFAGVTVTVRDVNANPVPGQFVALSSDGTANTLLQPAAPTDAAGRTWAGVATTRAELKTLTATVDPGGQALALDDRPGVVFVGDPDNVDPALSAVDAAPASGVIADGVAASTLTVTVIDVHGNPVPGVQVALASDGTADTLVQPSAATDADGRALGTLASTRAEWKTVTATVDPAGTPLALVQQPTVEFVGDPSNLDASLSSAVASPSAGLLADGVETSTVTVTVRDAHGNPVAGRQVSLAASGGGNTLVQPPGPTAADGTCTATLASTVAESKDVTVTVEPAGAALVLDDRPSVGFVADPSTISATLSTGTAAPTTLLADGLEQATLTATVVDAFGNPVPGQVVALAASGSGNTLVQPAGPTDSAGQASGTLASTVAESKLVSFTVDPGPGQVVLATAPAATFTADRATVSATLSSASVSPAAGVVADGVETTTLTVTVVDANANPVPGQVVQVSASGGGNTLVQPAGPTDAAGQVTATLASTVAEAKTFTVTVNPSGAAVVLADTPTVAFVGDPDTVSASLSSAVASPSSGVVADGVEVSTVTITVLDAFSNPVAGLDVQVAVSGSGNTLVQPAGPTDAAGQVSATLASTVAETKAFTVTVDPLGNAVVLAATPTVAFVGDPDSVSASLSSASVSPVAGLVANGNDASTVTVTVLDANSNPVPGLVVELAASGSGNVLGQPAGPTDAAGQTSGTMASTVAESKTLTVTVDPLGSAVLLVDQPAVGFVAAVVSASLSSFTASPAQGALADGSDAVQLQVTVRDTTGAPMAGRSVVLTATGTGNLLAQPAVTDGSGVALATLSSTAAETKDLTAAVLDPAGALVLDDHPSARFVWPAAGTRYVRVGGSDAAAGTSPATAWATLGRAALAVGPGDVVHVGAGTYPEAVAFVAGGSPGSPVVFAADTDGAHTGDAGEVRIEAGGAARGFQLGVGHVTLRGFTVTGAQIGVEVGPGVADGVLLLDLRVHGNDQGLLATGATGLVVESCAVSNNAAGHGLELAGCTGATVTDNLVYNNAGSGLLLVASQVVVRANTLYRNGGDQLVLDASTAATVVRDNLISEGLSDGIALLSGPVTESHNLVWGHAGLDFAGLSPGAGSFSADPLLVDPDGPDGLLGGDDGADDVFAVQAAGPASPALDAGSEDADQLALADGSTLADRSVRVDGLLDGEAPDGDALDLGRHALPDDGLLPELGPDDLRLVYAVADGSGPRRRPRLRTGDGDAGTWSAPVLGRATGGVDARVRGLVHEVSPLAGPEELLAVLSSDGSATELDLLTWDGVAWTLAGTSTDVPAAHANRRGFDLAYEQAGGDALFVRTDGGATPVYRARAQGAWGEETPLPLNDGAGPNPDTNAGVVTWVELVARPQDDALALAFCDQNDDLVALRWDGAAWEPATALRLSTALSTNTLSFDVENRAFDAAFESVSGELVVAWAAAGTSGFRYATLAAGATSWSSVSTVWGAPAGTTPHFVDLASEPGSDRIAGAFADLSVVEQLGLATWTGSAWVHAGSYETQLVSLNGTAPGDFPAAVGWVGSSGVAVCVYTLSDPGDLDWARWTSGSGWSVQGDVAVPGLGQVESVLAVPARGASRLTVVFSDSAEQLHAASTDGTSWTLAAGGAALESELSTTAALPFALAGRGRLPFAAESRAAAFDDDAEDRVGSTLLGGASLAFGDTTGNQAVGLRFPGLAVPRGATVTAAWLELEAAASDSAATALVIEGQAGDDPPAFTAADDDVVSRPRTAAAVPWSVSSWSAGSAYRSPDLTAVLQELVDRPDRNDGEAVVLILTGTGERVATAFDGSSADAPLLHVEYLP